MTFMGKGRAITESLTGETKGFIILNQHGNVWDHRLYRTEFLAQQGMRANGVFGLKIVPATQKLTWDKTAAKGEG